LKRTLAAKSVASCGMSPSRARSSPSPTRLTSTPSIAIAPPASSHTRKSATARLDLPEPVRPATPTFSRGAMLSESPLSTSGPSR